MNDKTDSSIVQSPTAALLDTDSAGKVMAAAGKGITRVICRTASSGGTGFLPKRGVIITAAHVVAHCSQEELILVPASGIEIQVASVQADPVKDLAILYPISPFPGEPLPIAQKSDLQIGTQVTT